ncbi:hypothetical protein TTHERM_01251290 (macronuclear) [Tetrahymena thermophila SB210]|uniref:Uncharacterized protein n=1 Tax=Tetrahymena thermophila (strain SB210) TaxID=312017 RepID=Q23I92_TETTS|nr:hypothetical protein TTHERM_01251290 [Tetrahymena thermophila SB210]EAR96254.3 hypothetical protein TTHERM_01251290 [Tetrahymena thermophila SB210]|eukprot:XP_001016499.3 hypothetical protein TTHERM_01251290 [Tetrahymena thermophila SB210]
MSNFLFKIEFNPNDFPEIKNLENFYLDAFHKSYELYYKNQLSVLNSQTIEPLKQIEPNTGFLYSKKENNQNSKTQLKGGLESVIKKLNLKLWNDSHIGGGKVVNYEKIKFLIGVKPDSDIYVRVVAIQQNYQCFKEELQQYYLVHFYKYKHDIQRANIQPINTTLRENRSNLHKMEEELEQPQNTHVKQEYQENQEESENKFLKRQVEQLQKQFKEQQEISNQQSNLINILFSKYNLLENKLQEIMKCQNTIILD